MGVTVRSPNWRLWRFATEMERLRDNRALVDVQRATGVSPTTIWRIENAERCPKEQTVLDLLNLYKPTVRERRHVLVLWREARDHDATPPDAPALRPGYNAYKWIEKDAEALCNIQTSLVQGLLQTEAYCRATIADMWPTATPEEVEQHVKARIERQALLVSDDPLHLTAVIDEAALRRWVGGPEVMAEQMQRLQVMAAHPHISLQVIPNTAGAYAGMPGGFALLTFAGARQPEAVYLEGAASEQFLMKPKDVDPYLTIFKNARQKALSRTDSIALIASVERDYKEAA